MLDDNGFIKQLNQLEEEKKFESLKKKRETQI
jgi:hypothetical protein